MGPGFWYPTTSADPEPRRLLKNLELFGAGNILVTSETPETLAGSFERLF